MLETSTFAMLGGSSLMLGRSNVTKAYGTNYKMYGVKQFPSASSAYNSNKLRTTVPGLA